MSLIEMAAENPLAALMTCQCDFKTLEDDYEKRRNELLAGAYAGAYYMEGNWEEWKDFIKLPFWNRYKKKPRRDKDANRKLLLSMKFALGECGPSGDKRAWYYTVCLKRYFNARVKPEDLLARIEEDGGITAIYRAEMAARRKARKEKEAALEATCRVEGGGDQATHSDDDEDGFWGRKKEPKQERKRRFDPFAINDDAAEGSRVRLRVPEKIKERLKAVRVRQRVPVMLERREDDGDWMCFKVLSAAASRNSDRRSRRKSETARPPKHAPTPKIMTWSDVKPKRDHG